MILLVGFSDEEVRMLEEALDEEVFSLGEGALEKEVSEIVTSPGRYRGTCDVGGRFLLMHNMPAERVRQVLKSVSSLAGGRLIPATTTPTSLSWKLRDLLEELRREDEYFRSLRSPPSTS